ncbi:ribonuclease H-like domain, Reverse transcriptase, RNA-dependent DNA polymerase [Artemisia annua]|uniref:Ribonuclease H-like domain, Reverse transcriptase, RNA-dependent DNA polymerase n=1 Tax=Artemisia annua TaxID=35608 RepID=A0A2U1NJG9_ARTAN|nr:ribonuclease H-like domain, Reverse transcriptase, RNA-dependent DNA polymerase [Artemisia annua]
MEIELDSINKNNTWTLTTLPEKQKAIGLKWVYKTKRDAQGKIIKHKARLVAKGYVQEQGIDFDEVFAPVARIETVRLILALAAYHGWQVHHLDVKSAFLHGDLKEEVYVTQPERFVQQGNSGKVYKLITALYGLRQAPRAWNVKLDQTLKSLDFKKCNLEQAIYTKRSKTSTIIVGVYVDDLIITGTPKKELEVFKSQMEEKFEMSDLGLLAYYLGIEVTQIGGEIRIKQTCYINKILKETSTTDSNDMKIPMDPGTKLVKAEDGNSVEATYYRSIIGSLRYLLHTRPDLSYSVRLLIRFMQHPKDHHLKAVKQQGNSGKVYKLITALYGLRQAPRAWNVKLDQTLKSLDFKKCNLKQAVYTKRSKTSTIIVGVYVDDLIITGTPKKELEVFKSQMEEKFEMSDLGLLAYYLGIEVTQIGGEIRIKQTGYINKILKETSMTDSNDMKIPMDPGTKLVKAEDGNSVEATYYISIIGSLRYLLHTRPDLSYSVRLLIRFMQHPKDHHLKAVKQVIRYIKGTKEHGIIYKKEGGCKIIGYINSSYGINTNQGKGTTGICTQKQPIVALSSYDSEFMAATAAACQALWIKRLLSELTGWEEKRITLKVDNISAIALVKNLVFHGRSKHIDIRYHFIRECVENGHINVEHVSGELQRADILTKALPRLKFACVYQEIYILKILGSKSRDIWDTGRYREKPNSICCLQTFIRLSKIPVCSHKLLRTQRRWKIARGQHTNEITIGNKDAIAVRTRYTRTHAQPESEASARDS